MKALLPEFDDNVSALRSGNFIPMGSQQFSNDFPKMPMASEAS
jgi:hypothetical protein